MANHRSRGDGPQLPNAPLPREAERTMKTGTIAMLKGNDLDFASHMTVVYGADT